MQTSKLIEYLLESREGQLFECKRAAARPADVLESVVAMANAEGGWVVLGLEDSKKASGRQRLIGVSESTDNVSELLNLIPKEVTPPLPRIVDHSVPITNTNGKLDELRIFIIDRSADVHSLKRGDTLLRRGSHNRKLTAEEIIRLKYAKGAIRYEGEDAPDISMRNLDGDLLQSYMKHTGSQNQDIEQFLKDNGLAAEKNKHVILNKACTLLFSTNPAVALKSKCSIKVSHYYGTKANFSGEPNFVRRPFSIEGPLISQIQAAVKYLHEWLVTSPPRLEGASFRRTRRYPEWVLQEAIVNAVIHRDYSIQDDIHMRIFDDRIVVESPGIFPGHVTPANIRKERFARNPIILRTLNRFGEEAPNLDIGEGVDRMFQLMTEANLYEPIYLLEANSVAVVLLNQERTSYWETVSQYLDQKSRITNRDLKKITGMADTLKASRLLREWTKQGLITKISAGGPKHTYYEKPGAKPSSTGLFS